MGLMQKLSVTPSVTQIERYLMKTLLRVILLGIQASVKHPE